MKLHFCIVLLAIFFGCEKPAASAEAQSPEAVRGVWLTNIASDALFSRENIEEAVRTCADLGFNTIFVVTWNKAHTLYPSKLMENLTGEPIHAGFEGRDPLRELIEISHNRGIKVFAWFEFGFASSYDDPTGGILIDQNPHWASRDKEGNITTKNKFQWMNAFHPEVQNFITGLVMEVVNNYDIDGIQGDDRLPALPSNGGYDQYTTQLYRDSHGGKNPPDDEKDYEWIKWRSALLTDFLVQLVDTVKETKPEMIISMAPSIYPWSEENYLQDWPGWMNLGLVDLIIPQFYRYDIAAYRKELNKALDYQLNACDKNKFYPGVLLQVDDYNPSDSLLRLFIETNREFGINGEVFFFYEGIKQYPETFRELYGEPIAFPGF